MKVEGIIGLIGNPNSGKTTLFNQLTGARQQVGNWPGVTVERKTGTFSFKNKTIQVVDLPGVYSLSHITESSMDEEIARNFILSGEADVLVNVLDGSNLERHLYLTAQLLEMQVPMVIAVNMIDVLEKKGVILEIKCLAKQLGCPVVPLISHKGEGVEHLKMGLAHILDSPAVSKNHPLYSVEIEDEIKLYSASSRYQALQQMETQAKKEHWQDDPDIMIASARYTWAHEIAKEVLGEGKSSRKTVTSLIDKWVLNRFMGIPIFLLMIYFMFLFAIHIGGIFQDFFDFSSDVIFVQGTAYGLKSLSAPDWLIAILAAGVGKGLNTTISFTPVLAAMFFCLSFLEASGYMARAAFVMDKLMQSLGLPGKALVPMIVGFGCNVPAIMGARTLSDPRDRILTVMMSPFMSCSARLAVYSVFVAAFFPTGGQNVVFMLYLLGMVMAIFTGSILRKTLIQGKPSPWIMELPAYHFPSWKALILPTVLRTKNFLLRAGKVIIPVCMVLGMLNALTLHGEVTLGDADANSILSEIGRFLTPIFEPMGLNPDNWPATVGLLTGAAAKEVVVATLNTLYVQAGHLATVVDQTAGAFDFWGGLKEAVMSIPEHIQALPDAIRHPLLASVPNSEVTTGVYGEMVTRFVSTHAALAYLLFVLLYVPCASTMAAIRKELNTGWMIFSICWSTLLAYAVAVFYYQGMTLVNHPNSSIAWLVGILLFFLFTFMQMRKVGTARHASRY